MLLKVETSSSVLVVSPENAKSPEDTLGRMSANALYLSAGPHGPTPALRLLWVINRNH